MQAQNIHEIMQLERKKKMDENKLRKINSMINDEENININILEKYYKSRHNRNIKRDNELNNNIKDNIYESIDNNEKDNLNKNENKYFTFSHGFIKNEESNIGKNFNNSKDKDLNKDYKYINTLYDLTSSETNSNKNKSIISISNIQNYYKDINPLNKIINNLERKDNNMKNDNSNIYNYFNNINNENNILKNKYNYNNRNINLDSNLIKQKTETKRKPNKFNSDSRKYDKQYYNNTNNKIYKKISSPKIEIPSFIQARVNKYNYSNSKKSNSSKRVSVGQMVPYSLNYNFNYKYNYNIPSNVSNRSKLNYYDNNDKRYSKRKEIKKEDLNFKYIFFDNE